MYNKLKMNLLVHYKLVTLVIIISIKTNVSYKFILFVSHNVEIYMTLIEMQSRIAIVLGF